MRKAKILATVFFAALALAAITACGSQTASSASTAEQAASSASQSSVQENGAADNATTLPSVGSAQPVVTDSPAIDSSATDSTERKLKMNLDGQEIVIDLYDTPTARALYEALPMELSFSDFNATEKIAYPAEALPTEGEPDGCDPEVGDLCLYAPWGNLSIFYQDFRYSESLIKLGHLENGVEAVANMSGDFTVTLDRME